MTASSPAWQGAFLRLPNAANRAGFNEQRSYLYGGNKVDQQTHLGIDLASLANSPVPAANSGKVVFADYLGIYGNCVIVDHGLGLQTLYAHLSTIDANVGDQVDKGSILGRTGATGMAGGDHLHYGVTIAGIPVNPWNGGIPAGSRTTSATSGRRPWPCSPLTRPPAPYNIKSGCPVRGSRFKSNFPRKWPGLQRRGGVGAGRRKGQSIGLAWPL
ncbi:MAG: M23 family metallopeptidase [Syntrophotaleaceae bacterium]